MSYSLKTSTLIFEKSEITHINHQMVEYRKAFIESPILNMQLDNYFIISNYITYIISNLKMDSIEQKTDIEKMVNDILPTLIFNVKTIEHKKDDTLLLDLVNSQLSLIKAKLVNIINSLESETFVDLTIQNEFLKTKYQTLENEIIKNAELNDDILSQSKIQKDIAESGYLIYDHHEKRHDLISSQEQWVKFIIIFLFILLIIFFCLLL